MGNHGYEIKWMLLTTTEKTPPKMNRVLHIPFNNYPSDMLEEKVKLEYEVFVLYLIIFS